MTNQIAVNGGNGAKPHFVVVPFLEQGHIIPMVDMVHVLAGRGAHVSLLTNRLNALRIKLIIESAEESRLPIEFGGALLPVRGSRPAPRDGERPRPAVARPPRLLLARLLYAPGAADVAPKPAPSVWTIGPLCRLCEQWRAGEKGGGREKAVSELMGRGGSEEGVEGVGQAGGGTSRFFSRHHRQC
ncbi:hypothetical protein BHE74_00040005 [Ensete ventricosum]|nr:hypothetical protein GW17_00039798 [Ensete ventricosum]RWW53503.1 hypothetical protein BHE74_00040005 [Ensete ventricosum]